LDAIKENVERLLCELIPSEFLVNMSIKDSYEREEFERVRDELIRMISNPRPNSLVNKNYDDDEEDLEPYERTGFGD
jgi:hypothetical protein